MNTELRIIKRNNDSIVMGAKDELSLSAKEFEKKLFVPGVIGPGEIFETVSSFLSYIHSTQKRQHRDIEEKLLKVIEKKNIDVIEETSQRMKTVKKDTLTQMELLKGRMDEKLNQNDLNEVNQKLKEAHDMIQSKTQLLLQLLMQR